MEAREPKRVLLVEDDASVRAYAGMVLRGSGYAVNEAASGAEALAAAEKCHSDVVVSDLSLPDTSGQEMVDTLRKGGLPEVPAVFMSGYSQEDAVRAGLLAEGETYLGKPFSPAELRGAVAGEIAGA